MSKFEVWENYEEQWDRNDIAPPDLIVEARDPTHAAEIFAEARASGGEIAVIVRGPSGDYYEIVMVRAWEADLFQPTTLKELCEP